MNIGITQSLTLPAFKRWTGMALCRRTRQMVSFFIGDRSGQSCRTFWQSVPEDYGPCRSLGDFWEACQKVMATGQHQMVGKEGGRASRVERRNGILRHRVRRLVSKTLSSSKSDEMHELYLRLFIYNYNLSLVK